jgi:hypothetical protein
MVDQLEAPEGSPISPGRRKLQSVINADPDLDQRA